MHNFGALGATECSRAGMFFGPADVLDAAVSLEVQLGGVCQVIDDARNELNIDTANRKQSHI